jgi:hypothetical protein
MCDTSRQCGRCYGERITVVLLQLMMHAEVAAKSGPDERMPLSVHVVTLASRRMRSESMICGTPGQRWL